MEKLKVVRRLWGKWQIVAYKNGRQTAVFYKKFSTKEEADAYLLVEMPEKNREFFSYYR